MAAIFSLLLLLFLSLLFPTTPISPYLSPVTLFRDYQNMLTSFRIYIYNSPKPFTFSSPSLSLFHTSLLNSPFVTQNPDEAQLFFVPFSPDLSTRALSRFIRDLRTYHPFWNRTLGADHFYLSVAGIDYTSDRNVVELKKNSVQISLFPTTSGYFIPHKDLTLPPLNPNPLTLSHSLVNGAATYLGYMTWSGEETELKKSWLIDDLRSDPDFVIGSEPSAYISKSKYCIFMYGGDVSMLGEAMAVGCVPVVITDRPIQDMPLMDVLTWSDMAVFVPARVGATGLKNALGGVSEFRYLRMRELGVTGSRHLVWNTSPQPHDAFHMVMYQLWLRRHTIRYARRDFV